jgi:hypothetical protein
LRILARLSCAHARRDGARERLERDARECAERGYLLLPTVEQRLDSGDYEAAYAAAADAAAIGERCGDADLVACARHQQGRIRLQQGQVEAGLAHLDETMVTVISGELSPLVTGLMYCSVIATCQQVYAFDRTREWTVALTQWCEGQPDMVAFAGVCQVHRAEIMQLLGTWPEAIEEARRACLRSQGVDRRAAAQREARFVGMAVPNYFRRPYGPGWALVGDAGYNKDFITAQGIMDAFHDAELCAAALDRSFSGERPFEDAMDEYQRTRDARVKAMYEFTCQLATLQPPPPEMQQLFGAICGNRKAMDDFARMNAGTISPAEFFAPENVKAIAAAA